MQRLSHLSYYEYQVEARGIHGADDVRKDAAAKAYIYDRMLLPKLPAERDAPVVERRVDADRNRDRVLQG